MNRSLALAALFAASCATTRSEELTEAEHRAEAVRHVKKAQQEEAKYQPGATVHAPARTPFADPGTEWVDYNPTEQHLANADAEMKKAAEHAQAANALAAFEDEACKDISPAERAACPLLASQVKQVRETRSGIRLMMKDPAAVKGIHQRLACHLAYATANGFDAPSCPLFVKGMVLRRDEGTIEMTGSTPDVVSQLQQQARRIFTGKTVKEDSVSLLPR
jgi:hypothetical protein